MPPCLCGCAHCNPCWLARVLTMLAHRTLHLPASVWADYVKPADESCRAQCARTGGFFVVQLCPNEQFENQRALCQLYISAGWTDGVYPGRRFIYFPHLSRSAPGRLLVRAPLFLSHSHFHSLSLSHCVCVCVCVFVCVYARVSMRARVCVLCVCGYMSVRLRDIL